MTEISCKLYTEGLMAAMARLKKIPMSKVVRNAARDFAREGYKRTPTAAISKSPYYTYVDRDGQRKYLHESQVSALKGRRMLKRRMLKGGGWQSGLRRVRVARGWSKASWLGIFAALGMPLKSKPASIPATVASLSTATASGDDVSCLVRLEDHIRFDRFGKGGDRTSMEILRAGFAAAARNMTREITRMMQKQWGAG